MDSISTNLNSFLNISYEELKDLNLKIKSERLSGKPESFFRTKQKKYLKEESRIKAVTVCFSDLEGRFHMLDYDKEYILDSDDNLTFDGSSIKGFTAQKESDLRLNIDWASFRWLPADIFGPGKVLLFADIQDKSGNPFNSCYRSQLKIIAKYFKDKYKLEAQISPEIEGFLVKGLDSEQNFDEKLGFELVTKGGYYHSLPQDPLRGFIDKVAEAQRAMGYENEKDHPEVAPSQFELNYKYTDIVNAADQIQLYKLVCRQIAKNMGYTATFLPKPLMGINGTGMHINYSLMNNGKNIFFDKNGKEGLSKETWEIIYSILYHAKDICLVFNSSVNSYRRLDPHFEAPNEIKVSTSDRGAMIRIPIGNEKSTRIEIRSVAPDTNPYLAFYVIMALSQKGLEASNKEKMEFEKVSQKREKLPGNIYDALRYFNNSLMMKAILGEENHKKLLNLKTTVAERSPKQLGQRIKNREILDHHEISNQMLWGEF